MSLLAEIPGCARLLSLTIPPGETETFDHMKTYLYAVNGANLEIDPPAAEVAEFAAGGAPIMPAGKRVVKNAGDSTTDIVFCEVSFLLSADPIVHILIEMKPRQLTFFGARVLFIYLHLCINKKAVRGMQAMR